MKPLDYWKPDTFEISSYKYSLKERVNKTYTTSGGDTTGSCTYTYNELGFRGDNIKKEGFKVMSLGCSHTEGVGVNDDETWPAQFCSHIENGVNLNFGTGGRSNDFICRCLMSYYDLIKPDLVLILYTYPHRREIYTDDNSIEPYIPTKVWGRLLETDDGKMIQSSMDILQNENSDFINWYKNHMLIKLFLESKKCNWIWDNSLIETAYADENMFSGEFGRKYLDLGADGRHPGKKHHFNYAMKIFNNIIKNHLEYLGGNNYHKKSLI